MLYAIQAIDVVDIDGIGESVGKSGKVKLWMSGW